MHKDEFYFGYIDDKNLILNISNYYWKLNFFFWNVQYDIITSSRFLRNSIKKIFKNNDINEMNEIKYKDIINNKFY